MTEDYNKNLLDYLCGNLSQETGNNTPILSENIHKATTLIDELNEYFPNGYFRSEYVYAKDGNGNNNGNIILNISYFDENMVYFGALVLLDNQLNILNVFKEYSSGTKLKNIENLSVAEDGTIFFIERNQSNINRFVLCNNISMPDVNTGNYILKLRKSYGLQGDIANKYIAKIIKLYGEPSYFICSQETLPTICLFTINVGSENEWEYYTYYPGMPDTPTNFYVRDVYATKNNDDELDFTIIGNDENFVIKYVYSHVENYFEYETMFNWHNYFFTDSNITVPKSILISLINTEEFYFAISGYITIGSETLLRTGVNVNYYKNEEVKEIFRDYCTRYSTSDFTNPDNFLNARIKIFNINNNIFIQYIFNLTKSTEQPVSDVENEINFAFVTADKYDKIYVGDSTSINITNYNIVSISNQFNFYSINNIIKDLEDNEYRNYNYMIYNSLNYNGEPFTDYKSLIPHSAILYDNNLPVFARNLYNLTNINNTNLSILNIPNTYLNDIIVENESLLSYNNNIISENNTLIEKNIYENLFINWYNSVIISNENNIDNIIQNLPGATRLSQSIININNDYDNAKMNKYRINYADNTSQVFNCIFYKIGNYYTTKITLYTQKEILNIEFISNDENTIYQTLNNLNLDLNKLYVIRQDVYIDNKIAPNELYYGDDEVYYQEEKVYY